MKRRMAAGGASDRCSVFVENRRDDRRIEDEGKATFLSE